MIGPSVAKKAYHSLAERRKSGPLAEEEWLRIVAAVVNDEFMLYLEKPPAARLPGRKRNPLFDLLATETGSNLEELTQRKARTIATDLAQIKAVCKEMTEEQIMEQIKDRCAAFSKKWPGKLTSSSLAKWWSDIGVKKKMVIDIYKEPPTHWREVARSIFPHEQWVADSEWASIRSTHGRLIWQAMPTN